MYKLSWMSDRDDTVAEKKFLTLKDMADFFVQSFRAEVLYDLLFDRTVTITTKRDTEITFKIDEI